jgi:hypothetical protein
VNAQAVQQAAGARLQNGLATLPDVLEARSATAQAQSFVTLLEAIDVLTTFSGGRDRKGLRAGDAANKIQPVMLLRSERLHQRESC